MNKLQCEVCGSFDIVKQNGLFVCQSCGCKYSVEEAKRIVVSGNISIDRSNEIANYLQLGQNALYSNDGLSAARYADKALEIDPKCVGAWLIKMYSYEHIAKVNDSKMQDALIAGINAINCSKTPETENTVYSYLLDRAITILDISIKGLRDSQDIQRYFYSMRRIDAWNCSDRTARQDQPFTSAYHGLATDAMTIAGLIPEDALKRHKELREKTWEACNMFQEEGEALRERYGIYGWKITSEGLSARKKITEEIRARVKETDFSARAEAEQMRQDAIRAKREEKMKAVQEYWNLHQEEKSNLEKKRADIMKRIDDIQHMIDNMPAVREKKEIEDKLTETRKNLEQCGAFELKRKKELRKTIEELENHLKKLSVSITSPLSVLNLELTKQKDLLTSIEDRLNNVPEK